MEIALFLSGQHRQKICPKCFIVGNVTGERIALVLVVNQLTLVFGAQDTEDRRTVFVGQSAFFQFLQKDKKADAAAEGMPAKCQQRCAVLCGINKMGVAVVPDMGDGIGARVIVENRVVPAQKACKFANDA